MNRFSSSLGTFAVYFLFSMTTTAIADPYIYFGRTGFSVRRTPAEFPGNPLEVVLSQYNGLGIAVLDGVYYNDGTFGLKRAFPDGSNPVTIVPSTPAYPVFTAIGLDEVAGKVYFGQIPANNDDDPYHIGMADLNGGGFTVVNSFGDVDFIAVDHVAGKVFWSVSVNGFRYIKSVNLNLTGMATVSTNFTADITGLAIDDVNHVIYYGTTGSIGRMNLDGTGQQTILNVPAYRITLDQTDGKIYWINNGQDIRRANLDGSNTETVLTSASHGESFIDVIEIGDVVVSGPQATPAVSTWGAIVLMLALMIAAVNILRVRGLSLPANT